VPDPLCEENLERPCGRGLFLIRHYMTDVQFHPPGNRLTMFKVCAGRNGHLNGSSNGNGQH
jgi:serine/threonine-protein kinase RsbW